MWIYILYSVGCTLRELQGRSKEQREGRCVPRFRRLRFVVVSTWRPPLSVVANALFFPANYVVLTDPEPLMCTAAIYTPTIVWHIFCHLPVGINTQDHRRVARSPSFALIHGSPHVSLGGHSRSRDIGTTSRHQREANKPERGKREEARSGKALERVGTPRRASETGRFEEHHVHEPQGVWCVHSSRPRRRFSRRACGRRARR